MKPPGTTIWQSFSIRFVIIAITYLVISYLIQAVFGSDGRELTVHHVVQAVLFSVVWIGGSVLFRKLTTHP